MLRIVYLCAIPELIAVRVESFRLFMVEVHRVNPKTRQRMKLSLLLNTVMVNILPQPKRRKDGIAVVYYTIIVSAICNSVEFSQCKEAIWIWRGGL